MPIRRPSILVAGTPGTGKSSLCQELISQLKDDYIYVNVSAYVKEHKLYDDYDQERDSFVLNEDALIDHLEEFLKGQNKSVIFEYHGCDLFEPDWFQGIFILRTSNDVLYDRLKARGYAENKLQENLQCEIFQVILDEAREAFGDEEDIEIIELQNNTESDREQNINTILQWIETKS